MNKLDCESNILLTVREMEYDKFLGNIGLASKTHNTRFAYKMALTKLSPYQKEPHEGQFHIRVELKLCTV